MLLRPAVEPRRFRSRLRSRLPAVVFPVVVVVLLQGGVRAGRRRLSRARSRLPARRAGCRFLPRLALAVGSRLFRRRRGGLVGREGEKGNKRGDGEEGLYDEMGSVEVEVEVVVMGAVIVFAHFVVASIYLVIKGEDGGLRRRKGVHKLF